MTIKIFTTGGSIDKTYSTEESEFVVGEPQIQNILNEACVQMDFEIESLFAKDSLEITKADRTLLLDKIRSELSCHVIITHGTDTLIETAKSLMSLKDKVIVLTGAMRPAAFKQTDAAFNIGCAFIAVQILEPGVYVVINGRIFHPDKVKKNMKRNRFEENRND